jgi:hypothetical protein
MPTPALAIEFHKTLNPLLWDGNDMRLDVRVALLKSAYAFLEFLDIEGLDLDAVHFTGSNASFNYTDYSDCDVHLVVDYAKTPCPELAENLFTTKKTLWNQTHGNVAVRGYSVELYVEDTANPVHALGIYDLLKGQWVLLPKKVKPNIDEDAVKAKVNYFAEEIENAVQSDDIDLINSMFDKLKKMRRAGLQQAGEFSAENLAFKALRAQGYIGKLSKARLAAQDSALTLEGCKICEAPQGGLNRCTAATVNAFAAFYHFPPITNPSNVPEYGSQVEAYLSQQHLKPNPEPEAVGRTVQQFVAQHPRGTHFIVTDGHAMALINGQLVDAANHGPDNRRIISAIEYRR